MVLGSDYSGALSFPKNTNDETNKLIIYNKNNSDNAIYLMYYKLAVSIHFSFLVPPLFGSIGDEDNGSGVVKANESVLSYLTLMIPSFNILLFDTDSSVVTFVVEADILS